MSAWWRGANLGLIFGLLMTVVGATSSQAQEPERKDPEKACYTMTGGFFHNGFPYYALGVGETEAEALECCKKQACYVVYQDCDCNTPPEFQFTFPGPIQEISDCSCPCGPMLAPKLIEYRVTITMPNGSASIHRVRFVAAPGRVAETEKLAKAHFLGKVSDPAMLGNIELVN